VNTREVAVAYAAGLPEIGPIADQMQENLRGTEYLARDGRINTIIPVPIGAAETPESIKAGVQALNSSRLPQAVLAFSINHVGEHSDDGRLQEVAELVETATSDIPFASTFFTENYSTQEGTMGNIRARLLRAAAFTLLRNDYHLSRFAPVITGDIDLLEAGTGLLPRLNGAVQGGRPFAQAAVIQGNSRHLHAAGLLSPEVSFPNMDKVLYFYDKAINEAEYAQHGVWNAMLLGDYFGIGGYDTTKLNGEDLDLQDRLFDYTGIDLTRKLPLETNAFAVVQPRRFYARMQSGRNILDSYSTDTDFSTVNDICRGRSYEEFKDISLDEAEAAITALWNTTGETGPLRTLGDAATWWRFRKITDSKLGRNPPEEWRPRPEEQELYLRAQRATHMGHRDDKYVYETRRQR
jgi:hypothetical protein